MKKTGKERETDEAREIVHVEFPGKSPNFSVDSESKVAEWIKKLPIPKKNEG